jgi:nucleoside 2-deoxyribosyltransferase
MLSGPMTGHPDFNYPAFNRAGEQLRRAGFHVENPAENRAPSPAPTWQDWMRLSLAQLLRCDAVVMLPGWWRSKGARIEWAVAKLLGIPVFGVLEINLLARMVGDVPTDWMEDR